MKSIAIFLFASISLSCFAVITNKGDPRLVSRLLVTLQEDETPDSLMMRFYGRTDYWSFVRKTSGIELPSRLDEPIAKGTIVQIPNLQYCAGYMDSTCLDQLKIIQAENDALNQTVFRRFLLDKLDMQLASIEEYHFTTQMTMSDPLETVIFAFRGSAVLNTNETIEWCN